MHYTQWIPRCAAQGSDGGTPAAPTPQAGPDVLAVIKDARADVARVQADAAKATADAAAKLAEIQKERDAFKGQIDAIEKAKGTALEERFGKLADDKKALAALVKGKLSHDEFAAYLDKLAPVVTPASGPAPNLAPGADDAPTVNVGGKYYRTEHAAELEEKLGHKPVHLNDVIVTPLPGARTYSMPVQAFRERLQNKAGNNPTGKPTKR